MAVGGRREPAARARPADRDHCPGTWRGTPMRTGYGPTASLMRSGRGMHAAQHRRAGLAATRASTAAWRHGKHAYAGRGTTDAPAIRTWLRPSHDL